VGVVRGVTEDPGTGGLVATDQVITVVDHGTGVGASILERLCVPVGSPAAPMVPRRAPTTDGHDLPRRSAEPGSRSGIGPDPAAGPVVVRPLTISLDPATPGEAHQVEGVRLSVAGTVDGLHIAHRSVGAQVLAHVSHAQLERASSGVHLHGGAVADDQGRTVLLLAPSGSGKSTLVAHLVHGGLDLLNDEQVAVHRGGDTVCAFTRPVAVKAGGLVHLPPVVQERVGCTDEAVLVTARDLGGRHRLSGHPVLVVLPERDPSAPLGWDLLPPGEALEALCANNLDLVRKPVSGLTNLAGLATSVPVVWLRYPDAAAGALAVRALLADPPPVAPAPFEVRVTGGDPPTAGAVEPDRSAGPWRVAPGTVEVALDRESVLFSPVSRAVVRLDPVGRRVWDTLAPVGSPPVGPGSVAPVPDPLDRPAVRLHRDELRLVARLRELGLVEGGPAPHAGAGRGASSPARSRRLLAAAVATAAGAVGATVGAATRAVGRARPRSGARDPGREQ
jgi:hypothetical protein